MSIDNFSASKVSAENLYIQTCICYKLIVLGLDPSKSRLVYDVTQRQSTT